LVLQWFVMIEVITHSRTKDTQVGSFESSFSIYFAGRLPNRRQLQNFIIQFVTPHCFDEYLSIKFLVVCHHAATFELILDRGEKLQERRGGEGIFGFNAVYASRLPHVLVFWRLH